MPKLVWDVMDERFYEMGTDRGVLYVMENGNYTDGKVWNGLTAVNSSPEGAEPTDLYADNIKYASFRSAESYGFTIEAYTYPAEFAECDGSKIVAKGVYIGQQTRKSFGFSFRSKVGSAANADLGYKLHLIYGASAAPSEKAYATINDSPEAITFSWECETTPAAVPGYNPTSEIIIDSTEVDSAKIAALEKILYGDDEVEARLPLPSEVISILTGTSSGA